MSSKHHKYKLVAHKRAAALTKVMARLDTYSSTNVLAQHLMNTIKNQYEIRDIRNISTAVSAMDSLKVNEFNGFSKNVAGIAKAMPLKQVKPKEARDINMKATDEAIAKVLEAVDRKAQRPTIKTKNWESEALSLEIAFKRDFKHVEEAWKAGIKLLSKSVEQHMTKKQPNLKLDIEIQYTVIKQAIDYEDQDP
jgi:hypothetical protein